MDPRLYREAKITPCSTNIRELKIQYETLDQEQTKTLAGIHDLHKLLAEEKNEYKQISKEYEKVQILVANYYKILNPLSGVTANGIINLSWEFSGYSGKVGL